MLRQIEWKAQNGPITKKEVLPLIFLKIQFQYKNLLQTVDLIYQLPHIHIHTFRMRLSFI